MGVNLFLTSGNIKWSMIQLNQVAEINSIWNKTIDIRVVHVQVEGFVRLVIFPFKIRTCFTITDDAAFDQVAALDVWHTPQSTEQIFI